MPNPIEKAFKAARTSEKKLAGVSVTLRRDAYVSDMFVATVADTQFEEYQANNTVISNRSRDYIVDVEDYLVNGVCVTPVPGDVINEMINGKSCRFEVLALAGEQPYSFMDRSRLVFRVHTKEVINDYVAGT